MNDEHFDELIESARKTYRVPPEPPVDEMWVAIDADLGVAGNAGGATDGAVRAPRAWMQWRVAGLAAAAALVLGVGVGRWSTRLPAPSNEDASSAQASAHEASLLSEPLHRTTTDYLGEAAAMLQQFEKDSQGAYSAQATSLLATTRLLLDSPAASDQRMHELLDDLELILAQIAALRGGTIRRPAAPGVADDPQCAP